jgi:hypothetical protein
MCCSNARVWYHWQNHLPIECIKSFIEKLMSSKPKRTFNIRVSEFYLQRISLFINPEHAIQRFLLSFDCFPKLNVPEITVWILCIRFQQRSIERAMDLTDSFTWEDLPTRNADSGRLTAAGWIPLIQKYTARAAISILSLHLGQSTVRIVTNHETILMAWYPFDWTVSPFYELVNISQVTISKTESALSLLLIFLI